MVREKLFNIGAKVMSHWRYADFWMAEITMLRNRSRKSCG